MTIPGYTDVFRKIERLTPMLSEWTPIDKAHTLASLVIGLRPALTVEIGVWQGSSLVPMALAHRAIGFGRVIAVDPWSPIASIQGQVNPADVDWWSKVDHERAYQTFITVLAEEGLSQYVEVVRSTSDDFTPPDNIGCLHLDGNHSDQALRDIQRFEPKMARNGVIIADDYSWTGGGVKKACMALESAGWVEQYRLGEGGVWRRK